MKKVVIVGGGIAGLLAAYDASSAGYEVELFEANKHCGGAISSIEIAGVEIDSGAESFAITQPEVLQLIGELGLSDLIEPPQRSDARILADGNSYLIPSGLMGIPSDLEDPETVAILGSEVAKKAAELDRAPWNCQNIQTLGEVVRIRMGEEVLSKLVNPISAGVHASDSTLLEIESVLPGLLKLAEEKSSLSAAVKEIRGKSNRPGSAVAGINGGINLITRRIFAILQERGVAIHNSSKVERIKFDKKWQINLDDRTLESDYLILATKPFSIERMMADFQEIVEKVKRIKLVDVAVVIIALRSKQMADAPRGSGLLVADQPEGVLAKGSTHSSAKWRWLRELLPEDIEVARLSYGRNGFVSESDELLIEAAKKDISALYELDNPEIVEAKLVRWPQSLVQAQVGHKANIKDVLESVHKYQGLGVVGSAVSGNGIAGLVLQTRSEVRGLLNG